MTELQDFVFEHLYDPFSDDLGHHEQVSRLFVFSNLTAQQESSRLTATFPAKIVSELHAQLRKILELVRYFNAFD